jgi:hypothetical protein
MLLVSSLWYKSFTFFPPLLKDYAKPRILLLPLGDISAAVATSRIWLREFSIKLSLGFKFSLELLILMRGKLSSKAMLWFILLPDRMFSTLFAVYKALAFPSLLWESVNTNMFSWEATDSICRLTELCLSTESGLVPSPWVLYSTDWWFKFVRYLRVFIWFSSDLPDLSELFLL